jgi:DNA-binding MarR family transcriptional regulator
LFAAWRRFHGLIFMGRLSNKGEKGAAESAPDARREVAAPRARAARRGPARPEPEPVVVDGGGDIILAPALSSVVGYLLRRSHNAFQAYWMVEFRESATPITPVQGGMLVVLGANPGLTQTALARMMNVEGPTLMQAVDRLEQQDYVQRVRRPRDRRSYSLQLTPRGEEALKAINAFLPMRDDDLLADLTKQEIIQLAGLLTRIIERGYTRLKELQKGPLADVDADIETPAAKTRGRKTK